MAAGTVARETGEGGRTFVEGGPIRLGPGEQWRGSRFSSVPFGYYRVDFRSRAAAPGYWAVFPSAADGSPMRADTHSAVYASEDWTHQTSCFRGLAGAASCEPAFIALDRAIEVCDVEITAIDAAAVRAWTDALYAQLPQVEDGARADRLRLIPRSVARLRAGRGVRCVMLGDSIMQDLCASLFEVLVEPHDVGACLRPVPSVDGSKGCWHYVCDPPFARHVVDVEPDLLLVGGYSEYRDLAPVEALLERARRELACEVMLIAVPLGEDFRFAQPQSSTADTRRPGTHAERLDLARRQAELCRALGVEFLDLANPWHAYLEASGKPMDWFNRDRCHANDRGKQIAARLLARHFGVTKGESHA